MNYLSETMPKKAETKRIEVHLMPDIVKALQDLSNKENRSLKNYIETLIQNHVEEKKKNKK